MASEYTEQDHANEGCCWDYVRQLCRGGGCLCDCHATTEQILLADRSKWRREATRLQALVSEQAREIERLVEASTHAIDGLADVACVHGRAFDSNEYPDWDSHSFVFSEADLALREAIRCVNPQCPSVRHGPPGGGRRLAETARGVVFKEQGGDRLAVLGLWLYAECGKCGSRRYNPDIVGLDTQLAQALHEAVARPDS